VNGTLVETDSVDQPVHNGLTIDIVTSKADHSAFALFPYEFYANCPNWTPPLRIQAKEQIDPKKNPYFNFADHAYFLAKREGKIVGRIAAIHDRNYNSYHKTNVGFFGFFECEDNAYTAKMLFKIAGDWLSDKGAIEMLGPTNPSFFDPIGVLIEGFEFPNRILMPYNWAYYDQLILQSGLEKAMDLYAFGINRELIQNERYRRGAELLKQRLKTVRIRKMNLKRMQDEVKIIHEIYNQAWAKNWGFSPLPLEILQHAANDLKMIADPDLALVAEDNGKPVAFSITLPDLHQVLRKIGNGKLFPTGIFTLLTQKNKVTGLRTALAGVLPDYQKSGVDALMHNQSIENAYGKHYNEAEMSWVLETNTSMIRLGERAGGFIEKRYRMYKKALS
jgi:hypothetical protein